MLCGKPNSQDEEDLDFTSEATTTNKKRLSHGDQKTEIIINELEEALQFRANNKREMSAKRNSSAIVESLPLASPDLLESDRRNSMSNYSCPSTSSKVTDKPCLTELLADPVEEQSGERVLWEYHTLTLTRVPGYGFGIAVSGGRDNPHFTNGDPAIAISDVLKAGPAEGKLQVNDRILSANGISLENVDYTTAVQVLRDSGPSVNLVVKRRMVLPNAPEPQTLLVTLTRNKKKDDFGIVLGCKIYVKEVCNKSLMDKDGSPQEGDWLLKINNHTTDGLTLKEARKLLDSAKDRLSLVIKRDPTIRLGERLPNHIPPYEAASFAKGNHSPLSYGEMAENRPNYSSQNLYVQPPTRNDFRPETLEDKSNLARLTGRSRGPIMDVSLSQLDRPATPVLYGHSYSRSRLDDTDKPPPRPPPPRPEDYYNSMRQLYEEDPLVPRSRTVPDPRFISFQKEGSVGIRLTGGNEVGIFVTAVQPGSPASLQGLQPGDKILKVNDMDMKGVAREEAVLFLLSLQDQIDLIVQYRKEEYDQIVALQKGDSFYIKTHFNYDQPNKGEMSFRKGDVFHAVDTLHNGVVGSWQVMRIGRNNQEVQKGIVPNKSRAEELATTQFNAAKKELTVSENRGGFFRRRRSSHRRSKSVGRDHWDDVVFSDSISKFPAYERVVLKHPGFVRPIVLFGAVADVAREKLLRDYPDKFASPHEVPKSQKSGIIRLSAIRDIMERGKHAVLDITPNAVDRLNYAQFYPIVIFLRAESKHVIKELRSGLPNNSKLDFLSWAAHKSSKKLYEQCQKLEKLWNHIFTCTVTLSSPDTWFKKVREFLDKEQSKPIWMSESKPDESLSDDFLFPMTSRLSYASSPESDLDVAPESPTRHPRPSPSMDRRLVKSSSDPSIATQEDVPSYSSPPAYTNSPYKQNYEKKPRSVELVGQPSNHQPVLGSDSKYGFSMYPSQDGLEYLGAHFSSSPHSLGGGMYLSHASEGSPPELPPKIDRSMKPGRIKTAQERLFGGGKGSEGPASELGPSSASLPSTSGDSNYINAAVRGSSLDRQQEVPSPNSHDPYRFTRSTAQPVAQNNVDKGKLTDLASKFRQPAYKPVPPPKGTNYKPIPPPKPKTYRSPQGLPPPYWKSENSDGKANYYHHSKSSSMGGCANQQNGIGPDDESAGFDSGHGSSLDRNYDSYNRTYGKQPPPRGQYYYNIPPPREYPNPHNHEHSGLDLGNHEQRGSAFELYKKPGDSRSPGHHYYERTVRGEGGCDDSSLKVVATAKGLFDENGGTLESPETGVSIHIPPGAIARGDKHDIYFQVCQDQSLLPPLDKSKGEMLLSPLVMCGPHGLRFQTPVELRLPHCASVNPKSWSFALKSSDTPGGNPTHWQNVQLSGEQTPGSSSVSVLVDHF